MAENKKSFLLYCDTKETVNLLSDEQAGELFKHILSYVNDENPETNNPIIKIAFEPIKQALKRDLEKYKEIVKKRSNAGRKSAESRNKKKQKEQMSTSVGSVQQTSTNPTVSDNDSDIVIINNNNYQKETEKDAQWIETQSMQTRSNKETIIKYLNIFNNHLISISEQKQNLKDYKTHFTHWIKKQSIVRVKQKQKKPRYG